MTHDIKVGDIFSAGWGYDQTNIDFYEIVRVSEKSVWTQQLRTKPVETESGTRVVPSEGDYILPLKQVIDGLGNIVQKQEEPKPRRHLVNVYDDEQERRWKYSIKVHSWGT